MNSICILLTDHQSINDVIIKKSFLYLKKNKLNKIYLIGDKKKFIYSFKISLKIKKITFVNIPNSENNFQYLKQITNHGISLFKKKKINLLINMPLNKKDFLNNKFQGFTEFFSYHFDKKPNENMILYNKNFSVCPLTTHIELKNVEEKITKKKLMKTINNIYNFFYKKRKKIKVEVLGLNPHAGVDFEANTIDKKIIFPVVRHFKKKMLINGPVSADTAFINPKNKIFIGMYHDQVLIPFKTINKFDGINITIGKKLIRMSPDHGTGKHIKKTNQINILSFINCIKFCETYQ